MNIEESFVKYLETIGVGIFGQDIFVGQAPSSNKSNDSIWWIIESGGNKLKKAATGESLKQYSLDLYKRGVDYKEVKNSMYQLEELLNCNHCVQLDGYDTVEINTVSFPIDRDLDSESRKIGMMQINITTYKNCD